MSDELRKLKEKLEQITGMDPISKRRRLAILNKIWELEQLEAEPW